MRSNDLFRGLPYNIVQFTVLHEIVAGWLELEPGAYNHFSDSLHLYATDGNVTERLQPTTVPESTDRLNLSKAESDKVLRSLSEFANLLVEESNNSRALRDRWATLNLPPAYLNLAAILAADAVRRRGDFGIAAEETSQCSNACLSFMMERWLKRNEGQRGISA